MYNTAIMNKVMIHQFTGNNIPFYIGYGILEKEMDYHAHDHYELMIVLSGSATHTIEDQEYSLEKGDVYLVTNSFSHAFQQVKQLEHYNIFFDMDYILQSNGLLQQLPGFQPFFLLDPQRRSQHQFINRIKLNIAELETVSVFCQCLLKEYQQRKNGYETVLQSYIAGLMAYLSRKFEEHNPLDTRNSESALSHTITYMEENYFTNIPISVLADRAHLSVRQFFRVFQQTYQMTPHEYIQNLRLSNAKNLLLHTKYTLAEIASRCGFCDVSYFTKQYRKHFGYPPGFERKKNKRFPQ